MDPLLAPFAPCIYFGQSHSYGERTRIRRPAATRCHSLLRILEGAVEVGEGASVTFTAPAILLIRPGEAVTLGQGCHCQVLYFDCTLHPRLREDAGRQVMKRVWVCDPKVIDPCLDDLLGKPLPRQIPRPLFKRYENFVRWALDTWWQSDFGHLRCNAELAVLLLALAGDREPAPGDDHTDEPVLRAERFARRCFHRPIQVSDLAEAAGMSRSRFTTRYSEQTGRTPAEFLRNLRLDHAKELLRTTDQPIDQVARSVGLRGQGSLARLFRERFGQTPSEFRQAMRFES